MRLKFGQRCFSSAAPVAWNTLPPSLQQLTNTDSFKRQLKTVLFEQAFSQITLSFYIFYPVNFVSYLLPRNAMHKRGLCCHAVSVRLSVCLCVSVTFVDHVKTNKDIFKIFSHSGSHTILVFPCHIPTGTPLTGASNACGVGRNRNSEPISGLTACVNAATGRCCKHGRQWTATVSQ